MAAERLLNDALPPLLDPDRGFKVDPKRVGKDLAAEVRKFDALFNAAGHAQKHLETSQMLRNNALKDYDRTYLGPAGSSEASCASRE